MTHVRKILEKAEQIYVNEIRDRFSEAGNSHIDISAFEITFYDVIWLDNVESFKKLVDDVNFKILRCTQSNFFCKVLRARHEVNYRYKNDGAAVYINRIQFVEIDRGPRTAHLAAVESLNDLYV